METLLKLQARSLKNNSKWVKFKEGHKSEVWNLIKKGLFKRRFLKGLAYFSLKNMAP